MSGGGARPAQPPPDERPTPLPLAVADRAAQERDCGLQLVQRVLGDRAPAGDRLVEPELDVLELAAGLVMQQPDQSVALAAQRLAALELGDGLAGARRLRQPEALDDLADPQGAAALDVSIAAAISGSANRSPAIIVSTGLTFALSGVKPAPSRSEISPPSGSSPTGPGNSLSSPAGSSASWWRTEISMSGAIATRSASAGMDRHDGPAGAPRPCARSARRPGG